MLRRMNPYFDNYVSSLTPAKQLLAKEAVQEYLKGEAEEIDCINSAEAAWKKTRWLADKEEEHFVVFYMKNNFRLIKSVTIAQGGLDCTIVDIRVVLKNGLLCGATCLLCVHNHPSGSKNPSRIDDQLTDKVKRACEAVEIRFIDHVIVTNNDYYSYKENGKL